MSSRIIRRGRGPRGELLEVSPIQWRPPGQAAAAPFSRAAPAVSGGGSGRAEPDREKEARAVGYQQGVAAAETAAAQRAQARLEPALAAFQGMTAELAGMRRDLRSEAEEAAVALALAVARRVLHREIAADPEAILGLVKAAFQKCDARATQRLRVSPQDAETIREHTACLNLPPALEIVGDGNLTRGSAIFETSRGELDASVDTQLEEIDRGFADLLKRRRA